MNGTNVLLENIVVSAKLSKQPDGENWVQNTDGLAQSDLLITDTDTMDVNHVQVTNFTYTGGDDCIALKPRSYNVTVTGATCNGGNGIPIGSIGEYLEDSSVKDVYMSDLKVPGTLWSTRTMGGNSSTAGTSKLTISDIHLKRFPWQKPRTIQQP
ncbi:hypothetical protein AFCA_006898 [Aspergillus flavus]|nr:hypothetical protein AFCA_006898 [Aspergillus flavus]